MTRYVLMLLALLGLAAAPSAVAAETCTVGAAGTSTRIAVDGSGRKLLVHWPTGFSPTAPVPLVVLLHGSGGNGEAMLRSSRLAEAADRHGFVVIAPDGGIAVGEGEKAGFVWNIPGVPTITGKIPGPGERDDVAYLGRAIDWLVKAGCVDRGRVYATGLSGGGRMTSWLGCVAADRFAAIAPVVGLRAGNPLASDPARPDPATCRPSRAVPVIAFAGDKDTTNPIQGGGAGYWRYTMHAAEQRWAALNRCTAAPVTRWVAEGLYEERYGDCAAGSAVVGRIRVGGGHSWVADNDAMWDFFSRYRR